MSEEVQTCPRRNEGPRSTEAGMDLWVTVRWTTDHETAKAKHQAEMADAEKRDGYKSLIISDNADCWFWSWGPPRTCSFCGGIHPNDAIRLIRDGWEVEPTGKFYKRYLHPPGYAQATAAKLKNLRESGDLIGPSVWTPLPPVELYTQHFSKSQAEEFNESYKNRMGGS